MKSFRYVVIGRGLIGTAAGRHLSASTEGVAIVGPGEPVDRATHNGVFASHYDEGRMTRRTDPDPIWALTATRSMERFGEIERLSGMSFHTDSGYLMVGPPGSSAVRDAAANGRSLGADVRLLDAASTRAAFPFLRVPDGVECMHEGGDAGHISPRRMVAAQTRAAAALGATIIERPVTGVRQTTGGVEVAIDGRRPISAERVLVAAGAFTEACGLSPVELGLKIFGRTVVLAEIDGGLGADLEAMPTIGHVESGAYLLPPIVYPDGKPYVKLGIGTTSDADLRSLDDVQKWFRGSGSEANIREFRRFVTELIPALSHSSAWKSDTCAVTWTTSRYPIIDEVVDGVVVAVGGNGKGAKSADEWGRCAADLLLGNEWDPAIPRDLLRLPDTR